MEEKLEKFEENISTYVKELDLELADVEYVSEGGYNYLRVYVEKKDGDTTLDDCVALSRKIDTLADEIIKEKFFLEVSTPGLERKLKKERDFIRFVGEKVKIYTRSQVEGRKAFEGLIEKYEDGVIFLLEETGKTVKIPLSKLRKSNLIYEIPKDIIESEEE